MLGLKLIHVNLRGPWCQWSNYFAWYKQKRSMHHKISVKVNLWANKSGRHWQTTFTHVFYLNNFYIFWFEFHWNVFPMDKLMIIDNNSSLFQSMAWLPASIISLSELRRYVWINDNGPNDVCMHRQTPVGLNVQFSNIRRTLVGNEIVDHSDVVGASPVGAAPTTSSFST